MKKHKMTKSCLALFLVLAMVFGVFSPAFAVIPVYAADYVAQLNGQGYESLAEAMADADDGDIVRVLQDVEYNASNATPNGTYTDGLVYTGDKDIYLDLGGHTISCDDDLNDYLLYFKNKGTKANTVTIINGNIKGGKNLWNVICVGANNTQPTTLILGNGLTVTADGSGNSGEDGVAKCRNGSVINVAAGAKVISENAMYGVQATTKDGTVNVYDGATVTMNMAGGIAVTGVGTMNVYGGTINGVGVSVQPSSSGTPVANIYGGTIEGNVISASDNSNYPSAGSTVNIMGGTINGNVEAKVWGTPDEAGSTKLNITAGNITGNVTASASTSVAIKGGSVTGNVSASGTDSSLVISGGTFKDENGDPVVVPEEYLDPSVNVLPDGTIVDAKSYVAIGDSMTNGYGLDGYYPHQADGYQTKSELADGNQYGYDMIASEAYPAIVANAMGWDLTQLAISGMRPEELLAILDATYEGDAYTKAVFTAGEHRLCAAVGCPACEDGLVTIRNEYVAAIEGADVISINLGTNNFGYVVSAHLMALINQDATSWTYSLKAENIIENEELKGYYVQARAYVEEAVYSALGADSALASSSLVAIAESIVDIYLYGLVGFVQTYDASLNIIRELNSDADLIVVALSNPIEGVTLTMTVEGETVVLPAGEIMQVLIDFANLYMAALEGDGLDATFAKYDNLALMVDEIAKDNVNKVTASMAVDYILEMGGFSVDDDTTEKLLVQLIDDPDFRAEVMQKFATNAYVDVIPALVTVVQGVAGASSTSLDVAHATLMSEEALSDPTLATAAALYQAGYNKAKTLLGTFLGFWDAFVLAAGNEQLEVSAITGLFSGAGFGDVLADPTSPTAQGLLHIVARFMFAEGVGIHPSAAGHKQIADAILMAYTNEYTGKDYATEEIYAAIEQLKALVAEYYDDVYELAYDFAETNGYIAIVTDAIDEAIATIAAIDLSGTEMTDEFQIEAAIEVAKIVETLARAKAFILEADKLDQNTVDALFETLEAAKAAIFNLENVFVQAGYDVQYLAVVPSVNAAIAKISAISGVAIENFNDVIDAAKLVAVAQVEAAINTAKAAVEAEIAKLEGAIREELQAELDAAIAAAETALGIVKDVIESGVTTPEDAIGVIVDSLLEELGLIVDEVVSGAIRGTYVVKSDSYYVSLGDSTVTGMNTGDDAYDNFGYKTKVPSSFPYMLATALGLDVETQYAQLAMAGLRATDLRYILDESFTPDDYTLRRNMARIDQYAGGINAMRAEYLAELTKADLVTISFGNCHFTDFISSQVYGAIADVIKSNDDLIKLYNSEYTGAYVKEILAQYSLDINSESYELEWDNYLDAEALALLEKAIAEVKTALVENGVPATYTIDVGAMVSEMLAGDSIADMITVTCVVELPVVDLATYYLECMLYGYVTFAADYAAVLDEIHAIAPDALVVVAGLNSPGMDLVFSLDSLNLGVLDLGTIELGEIDLDELILDKLDLGSIELGEVDLDALVREKVTVGEINFNEMIPECIDLEKLGLGDVDLGTFDFNEMVLDKIALGKIDLNVIDLANLSLGTVDLGTIELGEIDLDAIELPAGEYLSYFMSFLNAHFLAYAATTPNTTYVDTLGTETFFDLKIAEMGTTLELTDYLTAFAENAADFHPTVAGHEYVKDQILAALDVYLLGDVDLDGDVDVRDAQVAYNHFTGVVELTDPVAIECADTDGDGDIGIDDVQRIYNAYLAQGNN